MVLISLLACGFGLDGKSETVCVSAYQNCCSGSIAASSLDRGALGVSAEMSCPDGIAGWIIALDGVPIGEGGEAAATKNVTINADLYSLGFEGGEHSLTLSVAGQDGAGLASVAEATFDWDDGSVDTGETGETGETAETSETDSGETGETGSPGLPNLKPGPPELDPSTAGRGDGVVVSFTVYSFGDAAAGASEAEVWLSTDNVLDGGDELLATESVGALDVLTDETVSTLVSVPSDAAYGTWYVIVDVDAADDVGEEDETDNSALAPLEVAGADVEVSSLALASSSGSDDSDVAANWILSNLGGEDVGAFYALLAWSEDEVWDESTDTLLDIWTEDGLAAGEVLPGAGTVHIPAGVDDGYVLLVADANGLLEEMDTSNNQASASYTIASVDLAVSVDALSPSSGGAGEEVEIGFTVRNDGGDRADAFDVTVYSSTDEVYDAADTALGSVSASYLSGGGSSTVTLPLTLPSTLPTGTTWLVVVADSGSAISESDEGNNSDAVSFTVKGIDLVASLDSLSATPTPGTSLYVYWSVQNDGGAASSDTSFDIYLSADATLSGDDSSLGSTSLSALAGGGTTSGSTYVSIPSSLGAGTWYLLAVVDPMGVVTEDDESNNSASTSFSLTGADLYAQIDSTATTTPRPSSTFDVYWSVYNLGDLVADANYVYFYLSTDSTFSGDDNYLTSGTVSALSSGGSTSGTASVTMPSSFSYYGTWYILVVVDATGVVTEGDETNNSGSYAVTISSA